jgi:hypothetical protein
MYWQACLWGAIFALFANAGFASQQATTVMQKWKLTDTCAKQAQTAFPDFSPDSNTKREARLKTCLTAIICRHANRLSHRTNPVTVSELPRIRAREAAANAPGGGVSIGR